MELMGDYQNVSDLHLDEQNGDRYQPEKLKPEREVRPEDPVRGKLSPQLIYTLLGLCVLLIVLILGTAIILMTQMLSEQKTSDARFRMELSQWKSNGNFQKINSSLAQLQAEISRLRQSLPPVHSFDQWRFFNKKLYYFSSTKQTWDEAQEFCASMNSKLVVINSAKEQEYIRRNRNCLHWIGLHDTAEEGTWCWVDGTNYTSDVQFWASEQPNGDQYTDEDCAVVSENGLWHDWPCSSQHFPICAKSAQ